MTNRAFLRQVSLFSDLSDRDLSDLESVVRERSFRKNEVIFHAQEPGNALFVIKR
ncbi:MAG TPA: Crp/Fnr family transcriptional regulator, partial [Deltaproteobacteria bacterium]|nr:Crp/Fnr family transcriptional regulator [Deltaproteobacteria bacterium]